MNAPEPAGSPPRTRAATIVAAVLALLFAAIAALVARGRADAADDALASAAAVPAPHLLETVALEITALGGIAVGVVLLAVVSGLLWGQRRRRSIVYLWTVFLGAGLLAWGAKGLMDRPRPDEAAWRVPSATYSSFPSGHATRGAAVFAALALLIAQPLGGRGRALVVGAGLATILAIAASRVFLGVHYPTDVLGGAALGMAWAAACSVFLRPLGRV
jgi:undecaprenyl-diphosphatase